MKSYTANSQLIARHLLSCGVWLYGEVSVTFVHCVQIAEVTAIFCYGMRIGNRAQDFRHGLYIMCNVE